MNSESFHRWIHTIHYTLPSTGFLHFKNELWEVPNEDLRMTISILIFSWLLVVDRIIGAVVAEQLQALNWLSLLLRSPENSIFFWFCPDCLLRRSTTFRLSSFCVVCTACILVSQTATLWSNLNIIPFSNFTNLLFIFTTISCFHYLMTSDSLSNCSSCIQVPSSVLWLTCCLPGFSITI